MTLTGPPTGATTRAQRRADAGVEANARLTGTTAAILLVLLAAEGATLVSVRRLLTPHVFIGMLLIPPIAVKIGSTLWRFARYYRGDTAYRRKGPPHWILRLLGPFVTVLTVALFASGILVLVGPPSLHNQAFFVHKVSFILWFGALTIHVLGHVRDTFRLTRLDLVRRSRRLIRGAGARQGLLAASLAVGVVIAFATVGQVSHYHYQPTGHHHHEHPGPAPAPPRP